MYRYYGNYNIDSGYQFIINQMLCPKNLRNIIMETVIKAFVISSDILIEYGQHFTWEMSQETWGSMGITIDNKVP